MDDQGKLENFDDEAPLPDSRGGHPLGRPSNPNSWFRKRLDQVRSEARKEIQLKSFRPLRKNES